LCHFGANEGIRSQKKFPSKNDLIQSVAPRKAPPTKEGASLLTEERKLVYGFDESPAEQVQVGLSTYKGKTYVELRICYKASDGEYRPSKKSIAVSSAGQPSSGTARLDLRRTCSVRRKVRDQRAPGFLLSKARRRRGQGVL
jgi:Transcriptional Coactivator p15 (PC4)